ncbi:hypothetical protein [Campylobacter cuniculorum]|nr:hypothetical protein [Campylobacter cuniculorum]
MGGTFVISPINNLFILSVEAYLLNKNMPQLLTEKVINVVFEREGSKA